MKIFKIICIILIIIVLIKSIKNLNYKDDFCLATDLECVGQYISKCEKICPKNYAYICNDGTFCSTSLKNCNELDARSSRLSSLYYHYKEFNFKQKIKKCPIESFRLKQTDFCLNDKVCVEDQLIISRLRFTLQKRNVTCSCLKEKHSFKCGKDFCTINNKVCTSLKKIKSINLKEQAIQFGIKKC